VRAGPSHTTTPAMIRKDQSASVESDPEKPIQPDHSGLARFLRTQQRASTIHSTLLSFHAHTPKDARSTRLRSFAARLMVNVPHSEAPSP
jgi:hypothetical protein